MPILYMELILWCLPLIAGALLQPGRMCGATNRNGTLCRRAPIRGGTRCVLHGGGSPLARMKAAETLMAAAWSAAEVLFEIIERWREQTCEACGMPKADPTPVIRACQVVLDRSGHHPSVHVNVTRTGDVPVSECMPFIPQDKLRLMMTWLAEARARRARGEPPCDELAAVGVKQVEGSVIVEADTNGLVPEGDEPKSPETTE